MREILFRGRRIDNGEWVEGMLIHYTNDDPLSFYISERLESYEIDPATVGQYTGIKDKNGKKIFEGDVLEYARVIICNIHEEETDENI